MPSMLDVDLERASVFLDFDGTITQDDVGLHLLEQLGTEGWWDLRCRYDAGEIGSRECIFDQWALIDADEQQAREVAREVPVDPGFPGLVGALRDAGAELTVISDGFGFYVHEVCDPLGVPVVTNEVDWAAGELRF